jgi:hypothetical protein
MAFLKTNYDGISAELQAKHVTLVAVSKTKPNEDIAEAYNAGQLDFGENYVQELAGKYAALPKNIRWHFIGHLQTNKVKHIAPFVHLIHGTDSQKLLAEIDKQAMKAGRQINCLLQVHIAEEETKFGFDEPELKSLEIELYKNVAVRGLMGMASFSNDENKVRNEFKKLKNLFDGMKETYPAFDTLSMGMSGDYKTAIAEGSNMVRIGSLLFGDRNNI